MQRRRWITVALALFALAAVASDGCATAVTEGEGGAGASSNGTGGKGTGGVAATSSSSGSATSSATASATASGASSTSASGTGGGPECAENEDCSALGDTCNVGACASGKCVKSPANTMGLCDDGLFCTVNDRCLGGACKGTARFCLSGGPCLVGSCNEVKSRCDLVPGNDGAPCDDQDNCTGPGSCLTGMCRKGAPLDCSMFDGQCTKGTCTQQLGCHAKPAHDGEPCDDGKFCSVNETCASGACLGVPTCPPTGTVCLANVCDEVMKTCTLTPNPNNVPCDDKNKCTAGETCQPGGVCGGGMPANQGASCNDHNDCTSADACVAGVCEGTPVVQCINGDFCCAPGCNGSNDNDCP